MNESSKTWEGMLSNGHYKFEYTGKSSDTLKELIKLFRFHLAELEKGSISE
jgi:hypothetical protein